MNRYPFQNAEALETIAIILLGIALLCTLEPISTLHLVFAGVFAAIILALMVVGLWQRTHSHR